MRKSQESHTQSGQKVCTEEKPVLPVCLLNKVRVVRWAFIRKKFSSWGILRTLSFYRPMRKVVLSSLYFSDEKTIFQSFLAPVGELANCLRESWSRCSILQPQRPKTITQCFCHSLLQLYPAHPWIFDNICFKNNSPLYWLSYKYLC